MHSPRRRRLVALTVLFAGLSVAPAAPQEPVKPSPLAEARYQAAQKQFEIIWSYYKQDRTDSFQVYVWSRLVLDARREMGETPADRRAALEGHLARMKQMEELVRKIRRLGFGRSSDVGATEYYRLEAEHWLAREKG
jgi:hypothetical protein